MGGDHPACRRLFGAIVVIGGMVWVAGQLVIAGHDAFGVAALVGGIVSAVGVLVGAWRTKR